MKAVIKNTFRKARRFRKEQLNTQQRRNWKRLMCKTPDDKMEEVCYYTDPRCPKVPKG